MRSRVEDKTTFMLSTPFIWGGLLPRQTASPLLSPPPTHLPSSSSSSSHLPDSSRILPSVPLRTPLRTFPRFTLLLCSFHLSLLLLAPPSRVMCSQSLPNPPTPTLSHLPSFPPLFSESCAIVPCQNLPTTTTTPPPVLSFYTPHLYFLTDHVV